MRKLLLATVAVVALGVQAAAAEKLDSQVEYHRLDMWKNRVCHASNTMCRDMFEVAKLQATSVVGAQESGTQDEVDRRIAMYEGLLGRLVRKYGF